MRIFMVYLLLFEYYCSNEIMQDEEEVGYVAGMTEVHTSFDGSCKNEIVRLKCE
jgi:hypothetical protein